MAQVIACSGCGINMPDVPTPALLLTWFILPKLQLTVDVKISVTARVCFLCRTKLQAEFSAPLRSIAETFEVSPSWTSIPEHIKTGADWEKPLT